jgi:hypothetical protein
MRPQLILPDQPRAHHAREQHARSGIGFFMMKADRPDRIVCSADQFAWIDEHGKLRLASDRDFAAAVAARVRKLDPQLYREAGLVLARHHNAYVNTGLNNSLDRESGAGGTAVGFMGFSSNTTAVTASTVNLNGASGGSAANTIIKSCTNARSGQTTTYTVGSAFVNGDFTSGVFVLNKFGLLTTSTDAGTGLVDVIGGSGGSSPYNRTFSIDLTAAGTFSLTPQMAVTASAL